MSKHQAFIDHIVSFTEEEVRVFLEEHEGEEFYAFAYDCNPETKGIYLSFNTEKAFEEKLLKYQSGEFAFLYDDEQYIKRLKYNPGDWKYQNFVSIEFIYDEKIKELFDVVLDAKGIVLMNFAQKALLQFQESDVYKAIPKTKGFIAYCIDHDEDELDALARALAIN